MAASSDLVLAGGTNRRTAFLAGTQPDAIDSIGDPAETMLSPRIRRLKLDQELLVRRFSRWPLIQITGTAGMPPEVYRFAYNIKGLYVSGTGDIQERGQHHL